MAQETAPLHKHSIAYNIFIFILTIISLIIMVVMLLPLNDATIGLLQFYDNLICTIFLVDFFLNLKAARHKSDYFIKDRGWLDLLGSIPSLGVAFKYSGIFRLARLSRLFRIMRQLRSEGIKGLVKDVVKNRSNYTVIVTILVTLIILASASVLVLQFESQSQEASITTGWDAFWYSIVTITTVGYGDYYPVTAGGRITAMFIMIAGIGIIGVLASLMSSLLVGERPDSSEEQISTTATLETEITKIKDELVEMRRLLEKIAQDIDQK